MKPTPTPRVEPLRPNDVFFLNAEGRGAYQHVGGVAILDLANRTGEPVTRDELTARLAHHLKVGELPRLHQRLAYPWGRLARPAWVEDTDFDIDRHVLAMRIGEPGGRPQLEVAVQTILAEPLDRRRPLWELWLVDGLDGNRQAVVVKMHHAIADGIGALAFVERLLDEEPHRRRRSGAALSSPAPVGPSVMDAPGPVEVFWSTLAHQVLSPVGDLSLTAWRAATDPRQAWRRLTQTAAGVWELATAGRAPPTPLNGPISSERRIALADVPRSQVRAARRREGGTDNDVILAATMAALHHWFNSCGIEPPPHLRTVVPVSTRRPGSDEPGSWTATLDIDLPTGPMGPRERLRAVTKATTEAKRSNQRLGSQFVMTAVGLWAPPAVHAGFARFAYRGTWFNLIVSNVPGVRRPRSLAGARVVAAYPIIPLVEEVGLTVAAMTWNDRLTFGFTADPAKIGALDEVAAQVVSFIHGLAHDAPESVATPPST